MIPEILQTGGGGGCRVILGAFSAQERAVQHPPQRSPKLYLPSRKPGPRVVARLEALRRHPVSNDVYRCQAIFANTADVGSFVEPWPLRNYQLTLRSSQRRYAIKRSRFSRGAKDLALYRTSQEQLHWRSLAPLETTRGFGMTPLKRVRESNHSGNSARPCTFQERWWTALVVARITLRPGAKANPTSPCPETSRLALPSGVILTTPRLPASDAAR